MAEKGFTKLRKGKAKSRADLKTPEKGPRVGIRAQSTAQINMVLTVKGYPYLHKNRLVAEVLAGILGGYMTSRLFMSIRERRGLAYAIYGGHDAYPQMGYLAVYAGVPPKAAYKVPELITKEFSRITEKGVTTEELSRAKENIRGKLALSLESTDEVAQFIGTQEMLIGKVRTPDQLLAQIDKVSKSDIQRVAREMFKPSNYYLACIGPGLDEEKLKQTLT
jgi:predicted Zn-dependent peptidase